MGLRGACRWRPCGGPSPSPSIRRTLDRHAHKMVTCDSPQHHHRSHYSCHVLHVLSPPSNLVPPEFTSPTAPHPVQHPQLLPPAQTGVLQVLHVFKEPLTKTRSCRQRRECILPEMRQRQHEQPRRERWNRVRGRFHVARPVCMSVWRLWLEKQEALDSPVPKGQLTSPARKDDIDLIASQTLI